MIAGRDAQERKQTKDIRRNVLEGFVFLNQKIWRKKKQVFGQDFNS
jgi:hypothetical protein